MVKGLILIPNALNPALNSREFLTPAMSDLVPLLSGLIAESEKNGRVFLKRFNYKKATSFRDVPIYLLNEHTSLEELKELLKYLKKGGCFGLISDCGLPVLADPGAQLIQLAREENIPIRGCPGSSSITLALMVSGLSTRTFTFHGYLPRTLSDLKKKIHLMQHVRSTHIFIETPYRNDKLLKVLIGQLRDDLMLCTASHLTFPEETVTVKTVKSWKRTALPHLNKKPTVFLLGHPDCRRAGTPPV